MKEILCIIIILSIISYCCYRCSKYYVKEKFKIPCQSCKEPKMFDTTLKCSTCKFNYKCKSCIIENFEYKPPKKLKVCSDDSFCVNKFDTSKLGKFHNNILVPDILTFSTKHFEEEGELSV